VEVLLACFTSFLGDGDKKHSFFFRLPRPIPKRGFFFPPLFSESRFVPAINKRLKEFKEKEADKRKVLLFPPSLPHYTSRRRRLER